MYIGVQITMESVKRFHSNSSANSFYVGTCVSVNRVPAVLQFHGYLHFHVHTLPRYILPVETICSLLNLLILMYLQKNYMVIYIF